MYQGTKGGDYYRLAMYDADGSVKYSSIELIKVQGAKSTSILPNPVKTSTKFTIYRS